jgi:hypothetical protein
LFGRFRQQKLIAFDYSSCLGSTKTLQYGCVLATPLKPLQTLPFFLNTQPWSGGITSDHMKDMVRANIKGVHLKIEKGVVHVVSVSAVERPWTPTLHLPVV